MNTEFHCCNTECDKPAEWVIYACVDKPDNDTHACTAHVGEMLSDAYEHRIFPISEAERSGAGEAQPNLPDPSVTSPLPLPVPSTPNQEPR